MNRKAYKILTDIDLSRNNLLNVSNIKGPNIDDLSKDLKIHADKGDLRIETTSDGEKGQIILGIDEKANISIKPEGSVNVEDNAVIVKGTTKLAFESSNNNSNSITLTSKDNSIKVKADIIGVGSEEDPIEIINEHIATKNSTIEEYIQTVSNNLQLTTEDAFKVTAEKTLNVTAGGTDKHEGKFDASKGAYLLNIEQTEDKFESTETIDNLKIRNSQEFQGSTFDIDSGNISLDANTISIGTENPQNNSLKIYGGFSENEPTFKLDVVDNRSEMTLKDLHTENLEIKKNLHLSSSDKNSITVDSGIDLKTPNLTLRYPNSETNVLEMASKGDESPTLTTTLNVDHATISTEFISNTKATLNTKTEIKGELTIDATTSISGKSLSIDSAEINLGNLSNSELNINAKIIKETTPSKTLNTTKSYTHTVEGTYEVTRSSDFEISASENDSHIKANTLTANNNVKIGSQNSGVNIYWDKDSKSLVFTKWE